MDVELGLKLDLECIHLRCLDSHKSQYIHITLHEHQKKNNNKKSKGTKYKLKELLFSGSSLNPTQMKKKEIFFHYSSYINLYMST